MFCGPRQNNILKCFIAKVHSVLPVFCTAVSEYLLSEFKFEFILSNSFWLIVILVSEWFAKNDAMLNKKYHILSYISVVLLNAQNSLHKHPCNNQ